MSESKQPRDFGSNTSKEYNTPEPFGKILSDAEKRPFRRLALDICPHGLLRRYVPYTPSWCRRIGRDVMESLKWRHRLDSTEIQLLLDGHERTIAKQEEERRAAEREEEREWRERLSAIELLKEDHREVEAYFEEYETLEDDAEKEEVALARSATISASAIGLSSNPKRKAYPPATMIATAGHRRSDQ